MQWMIILVAVFVTSCVWAQGLEVQYVHPAREGLDPASQFDFWVGEWDITNRTLQGDTVWFEWPSQAIIEGAAGGDAIVEFWNSLEPSMDIIGFSMRWYDPEAEEWVIVLNWPQTSGSFDRMIGKFEDGVGRFYAPGFWEEKRFNGFRYTFSKVTPTSLQWDQAMTKDGGKTWTTTWIMEWTRRDHVNDPIDRDKHHRVDDTRCEAPEARAFDEWVGEWFEPKYDAMPLVSMRRVLGGCGYLLSIDYEGWERWSAVELWTYDVNASLWKSVTVWEDEELRFGDGQVMDNGIVFAYKDRKGNSVGACNVAMTDGELYVGRQYLDRYIEWQLLRRAE